MRLQQYITAAILLSFSLSSQAYLITLNDSGLTDDLPGILDGEFGKQLLTTFDGIPTASTSGTLTYRMRGDWDDPIFRDPGDVEELEFLFYNLDGPLVTEPELSACAGSDIGAGLCEMSIIRPSLADLVSGSPPSDNPGDVVWERSIFIDAPMLAALTSDNQFRIQTVIPFWVDQFNPATDSYSVSLSYEVSEPAILGLLALGLLGMRVRRKQLL